MKGRVEIKHVGRLLTLLQKLLIYVLMDALSMTHYYLNILLQELASWYPLYDTSRRKNQEGAITVMAHTELKKKMVPETQCAWTQIHGLNSQIAFGLVSLYWSCLAVLPLSCTWLPSPTSSPSLAGVLGAYEVAACCLAWLPAPLLMWGSQPLLLPDTV